MSGINPSGTRLGVNNQYFTKNNQPWFPLMGELHYNRVRPEEWETEILKMKSGGLSIVATYIFWNEHEREKGVWDWTGNRDLHQFILLCQKHGLYVWLRIGPWSHGEQLNGGFPDWIQRLKGHRSNDPEYVKESEKLFNQIGQQAKGLFFADGGPIIGVQLENEYASGQAEHISTLKAMAQKAQINPVYWTVTANTVFDDGKMEVVPLQGAYAYRGWEKAGGVATKDFLYGNDQWIMTDALGKVYYDVNKFPRGLCEQGGGSQMTYRNRFVVEPAVITAHLQNQIGRGMNLIGYYMFHGGTQTPGLKEPGHPESYDFQAPIDEFGLLRPSYKQLKVLHTFINDFGNELAPMQVYEPKNPVRDEKNTKDLRYIARASGNSGFLFLGNTQVRITMPNKTVSMQVNLPNETIHFPSMLLKGQTTAILPFNLKAGSVLIKYVTAQPFAKLVNGKNITLFFKRLNSVNPQLALDSRTLKNKDVAGWKVGQNGNQLQLVAGSRADCSFTDVSGKHIKIVFITAEQAENAWRTQLKGQDALLITPADVIMQKDQINLKQLNKPVFDMMVYPKGLHALNTGAVKATDTLFDIYKWQSGAYEPQIAIKYPAATIAEVILNPDLPKNVTNVILNVNYLGDACNLVQRGAVKTDNLYNGQTWQIGLNRFCKAGSFSLNLKDWDDKTTGVPTDLVQEIKAKGTRFISVKAVPQYQTIINLKK
ncbi:beta-galactosidase [Pedobacter sp. GSP4]|uniref:beta-galactosidase n=1 Tax=Pedobacter sp. GSP4 TaxID=3453716 RepID=UPI003EEA6A89